MKSAIKTNANREINPAIKPTEKLIFLFILYRYLNYYSMLDALEYYLLQSPHSITAKTFRLKSVETVWLVRSMIFSHPRLIR